ncbi:hypothetical protein Hypma_006311 [Hypsizygus marmoreus]|uniref:F-box domain-containing protein n=1 Tax=Hypsizygus marmoreus TaxID=39966 RepID=A0A369K1D3_HYPMA|nr:hypothetical protein Hypma_006311 [Hypsizygus marmoreus]
MQPTSPVPLLPQEIIDTIISQLHRDPNSLINCSLVCRSWTYWSQVHLIQDVVCDLDPFQASVESTKIKIMSLHSCLTNSPQLSRHVTSFELRNVRSLDLKTWDDAYYFLADILECLQRVKRLSLQRVDWDLLSAELQDALVGMLKQPALEILDCWLLQVRDQSTFVELLSYPPNLKDLRVTGIGQHYGPHHWMLPVVNRKRQLHSLDITPWNEDTFFTCFLEPQWFLDLTSLRHLRISNTCTNHFALHLLEIAAPTLEHLDLTADDGLFFGAGVVVDLSRLPLLKSLTISAGFTTPVFTANPGDVKHCLREVHVRVSDPLSTQSWKELDELFAHPGLSALRRVAFHFVGIFMDDAELDGFLSPFPMKRERVIMDERLLNEKI